MLGRVPLKSGGLFEGSKRTFGIILDSEKYWLYEKNISPPLFWTIHVFRVNEFWREGVFYLRHTWFDTFPEFFLNQICIKKLFIVFLTIPVQQKSTIWYFEDMKNKHVLFFYMKNKKKWVSQVIMYFLLHTYIVIGGGSVNCHCICKRGA